MDKLIAKLGINEKFTKAIKQPNKFNRVKDNVPLKQDYNFMADLLFLPQTDSGYRYLLFIKANKNIKCIDLNDKNDICGLFLFDTKKDPALIDMPNIDTQLELYFSK